MFVRDAGDWFRGLWAVERIAGGWIPRLEVAIVGGFGRGMGEVQHSERLRNIPNI